MKLFDDFRLTFNAGSDNEFVAGYLINSAKIGFASKTEVKSLTAAEFDALLSGPVEGRLEFFKFLGLNRAQINLLIMQFVLVLQGVTAAAAQVHKAMEEE